MDRKDGSQDYQFVQLDLAGGMDESAQEELLDFTVRLKSVDNMFQSERGAWRKRYGFAENSSTRIDGTTRSVARRLYSYDDATLVLGDRTLDAHILAADKSASAVGNVPECHVLRKPVISPTTYDGVLDVAYSSGYTAIAYEDKVIVQDSSGSTVSVTTIASGVRLASAGTSLFAVWYPGSGTSFLFRLFNTTAPASGWTAQASLVANVSSSTEFDLFSASDRFYLAYSQDVAGSTHVAAIYFDSTGTGINSNYTALPYAFGSCSVDGSFGDYLWICWTDGSPRAVAFSYDLNSVTVRFSPSAAFSSDTMAICATGASTATMLNCTNVFGVGADNELIPLLYSAGAISDGGTHKRLRHWGLLTKPFLVGTRTYATFAHSARTSAGGETAQRVHAVVDVTPSYSTTVPLRGVATIGNRTCADTSFVEPRHYAKVNSYTVVVPHGSLRSQVSFGIETGVLKFWDQAWAGAADYSNLKVIGCGFPTYFDGVSVAEVGYSCRPVVTSANVAATAGAVTGTVAYTAIWEDVDAKGNINWSATAIAKAHVASANVVNVTVDTLQVSQRTTRTPTVVVYRTANGGTTYYRCNSTPVDYSASTVVVRDNVSDATLTASAKLYRQPGVTGTAVDRQSPPSFRFIIEHKDRLVGVADDGQTLWLSSTPVLGEGPWFSDLFQYPVTGGTGDIVALASMDGKLIVFKESSIFVLEGDGPPDNGGNGTELSPPYQISSDVGCVQPRSVLSTSQGVFFLSTRGIELLTRSLQVGWIGERIKDTLDAYPVITSATFDPQDSLVRFECCTALGADGQPSSATGGKTLVYDTSLDCWSTETRTDGSGNIGAPSTATAIAKNSAGAPTFKWVGSGGTLNQQDRSTSRDSAGYWTTASMETGWFRMSGPKNPQGQEKAWSAMFLSRWKSNHSVNISMGYDYNPSYAQTGQWLEANTLATSSTMEQLQLQAQTDRSQSVRVRWVDYGPTNTAAFPVGNGAAATILGIGFKASQRINEPKLPKDNKR